MSRLVLHIGTHKTATTSIQRFLRRNGAALARRGVWYPHYRLVGKKPHHAHLAAVNGLAGQDPGFDPDTARRFFETVRDRAAGRGTTVISAESLWRHLDIPSGAPPPADPEAYWAARRRYVAGLRDLLGPARVVVVLRRRDAYAASLYQEHVKATRYRGDFAAFRREMWWHFDYLGQVRAWAEAFPDPVVLGFEQLVAGGDPVGAFCAALGIDADGLPRPKRQNEGLLADLVVLKRGINGSGRPRAELRARVEALEAAITGPDRAALARRSLWASAAEADAFREAHAGDDAALAAGFAPDLAFPDDPADPKAGYGDAFSPRFLDLLARRATAAA